MSPDVTLIRTIGPWFLWIHICPTPPKKKKKKSSPDALVSSKKTPVNKHWYETCWNMLKRFQLINYICSVEPEDTVKQTHQDSITENFQTLCVHWEEESHFGSNWSLFLPDIWIFSQTHLQNKNKQTNNNQTKRLEVSGVFATRWKYHTTSYHQSNVLSSHHRQKERECDTEPSTESGRVIFMKKSWMNPSRDSPNSHLRDMPKNLWDVTRTL